MSSLSHTRSAVKPFIATPNKKAYIIRGHGSEGENTFTVPKNCVIVVKEQAAAGIYDNNNRIYNICSLSPTILKNPMNYPKEIHDAFGSVAIYLPGNECPNFNYSLLSCFPTNSFTYCASFGSGIIDIDTFLKDSKKRCIPLHRKKELLRFEKLEERKKSLYNYHYIRNLFKHSVNPMPEDLLNYIDDESDKGLDITSLSAILDNIDKHFHTTQKELCRKEGVYYNFVCRANEASSILFTKTNDDTNILHNSIESILSTVSKEKNKEKEELIKNMHKTRDTLNKAQNKYTRDKKLYTNMQEVYQLERNTLKNTPELQTYNNEVIQWRDYIQQTKTHIDALHGVYKSMEEALKEFPRSTQIERTLKSHIGEAEAHRKPYIKRMYNERYAANIASVAKGGKYSIRRTYNKRNNQTKKKHTM